MKPILFVVGTLTVLSCSDGREQPIASKNNAAGPADLTLPGKSSRTDTSASPSSGSRAIDSIEQREKAPVSKARPARRAIRSQTRTATAPTPPKPTVDTAVQGYAPADTVSTLETSTQEAASPSPGQQDSVAASSPDTLAVAVDTTPTPEITTPAPTIRHDTMAQGPGDTTSTLEPDTRVASPRPVDVAARTLPVGTEIHASLNDSITSRRDTVGQIVSAHVMENVRGANGRTLIRAGTPVQFTVTRIRPARSKSSEGRLALDVNGFEVEGDLLPVQAEVRPVPRELRGRGVGGSEVAKVGGGAAAGAILGRVVGGNTKGAVIGGVAGAAAGAVLADQTATRDVVVKAKTPVVFVLSAPLLVTP